MVTVFMVQLYKWGGSSSLSSPKTEWKHERIVTEPEDGDGSPFCYIYVNTDEQVMTLQRKAAI